jgi:hypothetical protein
VWRAAFRIAAGELKDRRRFGGTASDAAYEMEGPPARLVAGLARLSPNQRAALVLHYYAGYPTKEIAGILGFTVDDIDEAHRALAKRGIAFRDGPHVVHRTEDAELRMAFFTDPDGNNLALMSETPIRQMDG